MHRGAQIEEALASVAPAAVPAFRRRDASHGLRQECRSGTAFQRGARCGAGVHPRDAPTRWRPCRARSRERRTVPSETSRAGRTLSRKPGQPGSRTRVPRGREDGINRGTAELRSDSQKSLLDANRDSDDESYHAMVAQLAIGLDDNRSFREALEALTSKHPRTAATHYFAAIAAAMDERWEQAEDEIREAERLGLPHEAVESFLASGVHSRANVWSTRATPCICSSRGLWACCCCSSRDGFYPAGCCCRSSERIQMFSPPMRNGPYETIYRTLINCAGVYYYVSLPFVVVLVFGGTAAAVYGVRNDWPNANQTRAVPRDRCRSDCSSKCCSPCSSRLQRTIQDARSRRSKRPHSGSSRASGPERRHAGGGRDPHYAGD